MLELLKQKSFVPSPLMIESENQEALIRDLAVSVLSPGNEDSENFQHPDWIHLDSADLKLESLRDALYELRHRPFSADHRVFSIENFQDCNKHIQNALLKTLEEPLDYWVILLGVRSIFGVLPTIRSRCLFLKKRSFSQDDLDPADLKIYKKIEDKDPYGLYKDVEHRLKSRSDSKTLFQELLKKASQQSYPGHWKRFAPELESAMPELARNLNPKNIWEKAWERSLEDH